MNGSLCKIRLFSLYVKKVSSVNKLHWYNTYTFMICTSTSFVYTIHIEENM